ncbi:MAG: transcriptional repressor [Eubacteriales bacterium]
MNKYTTEQRKKLMKLFEEHQHHTFSAQDIATALSNQDISTSAIYRNLSAMVGEGLICKVSEKNRTGSLYQYVDPVHCEGIIHFKCENCDATFHLNTHISQMVIAIAQESHDFQVNGSAAYLYGLCEKCSQLKQDN